MYFIYIYVYIYIYTIYRHTHTYIYYCIPGEKGDKISFIKNINSFIWNIVMFMSTGEERERERERQCTVMIDTQ